MATKIKDNFELQISHETVARLKRTLAGYEAVRDPDPNCLDGIRFIIEKVEGEIEAYLTQKAGETLAAPTQTEAASG